MASYASYVICTAPRSGSTLLCKLLAATGIAGKPASYFYDPSVEDWLAELGVEIAANQSAQAVLEVAIRAVTLAGRNGTDVFGLRQQAPGLGFLCGKLAELYPGAADDAARFRQAFGATLFIHLTRSDKIAQAVSLLKAQQTGLWHMAPDGTELERSAPHKAPLYDGQAIESLIAELTAYDAQWNAWFAREGITPVRLTYDDLAADPVGVLSRVLGHLGLDQTAANVIVPGVRKLADQTSADWAARFRAEKGVT